MALCAYAALTGEADGPSTLAVASLGLPSVAVAPSASLTFSGTSPVITGSIDHLFESSGFTGPNRSEKTDRFKPVVDVVAMSLEFESVRRRIASLRPPDDPAVYGQSSVETAEAGASEAGPRMSVAVVDPAQIAAGAGRAALDAIASIAPANVLSGSVPAPVAASEQLAYARANAPVTGEFATGESMDVAERQLWCLATAIYFEARGETYRGQVAVAQVVLNRVRDHRYPDTICGVVFQNQHRRNACQFSFACDGIPETINDRRSWAQAEEISEKVTSGELYLTEVGEATHYHATYVRPAWAGRMDRVTQIGLHVFYKFRRGWLFGATEMDEHGFG